MSEVAREQNGDHSPPVAGGLSGFTAVAQTANPGRLTGTQLATGAPVEIAVIDISADPLRTLRTIGRTRIFQSAGATGLRNIKEIGLIDPGHAYLAFDTQTRTLADVASVADAAPAQAIVRLFAPIAEALALLHENGLAFGGISGIDIGFTDERRLELDLAHAFRSIPLGEDAGAFQERDIATLTTLMQSLTLGAQRSSPVDDGPHFASARELATALRSSAEDGREDVNSGTAGLQASEANGALRSPRAARGRRATLVVVALLLGIGCIVILLSQLGG